MGFDLHLTLVHCPRVAFWHLTNCLVFSGYHCHRFALRKGLGHGPMLPPRLRIKEFTRFRVFRELPFIRKVPSIRVKAENDTSPLGGLEIEVITAFCCI